MLETLRTQSPIAKKIAKKLSNKFAPKSARTFAPIAFFAGACSVLSLPTLSLAHVVATSRTLRDVILQPAFIPHKKHLHLRTVVERQSFVAIWQLVVRPVNGGRAVWYSLVTCLDCGAW